MRITLASRPSNDASLDMGVPPRSRCLYGRSGRAALTAGTLTPVGDNTAREHRERDVVFGDANRYDPNVMHDPQFSPDGSASRKGRSRGDSVAMPSVTQRTEARIGQERAVLPQKPGTAGGDGPSLDEAGAPLIAAARRSVGDRMIYQVCSTSLMFRPQRNSWKAAPYMGWPRL